MNPAVISESELLVKERELFEAIKANDIIALEGLIHDNLQFILPNGNIINKQQDIESHQRREMVVQDLEVKNESINLFTDTAVILLSISIKGLFLNEEFQGKFRYLRVWKKVNQEIKIIGGSCTMLSSASS